MTHRVRPPALFAALGLAALTLFAARVLSGPVGFGIPQDPVLLELRLLMALAATAIGLALATAGTALQAVLRNPLASPYVLGMTAGAALGVVLDLYITHATSGALAPSAPNPIAALLGAALAAAATFTLARTRGVLPAVELILVGVIVGTLCGSISMALQYTLPDRGLATAARWMMGEVNQETPMHAVLAVLIIAAFGVLAAHRLAARFDAATLSDLEAHSIGAPPDRTRTLAFALAVVLTASVVYIAGPIGFVGLVAPHLARTLVGPRHRLLIPAAALCGIVMTLAAELIAATLRTPSGRLPVGVITALIGGPAFILILRASRTQLAGASP